MVPKTCLAVVLCAAGRCDALAARVAAVPARLRVAHPCRCSLAEERAESAKVAVASAVCGGIAMVPAALLAQDAFSPRWEFEHDALALMLALFGVVYRYAVRSDNNDMLKQGVVGAFALTRSLSAIELGDQCSAMPLKCGAPLGYYDWSMLAQLGGWTGESFLAFGAAAFAIEAGFERGLLKRLPPAGLPGEDSA